MNNVDMVEGLLEILTREELLTIRTKYLVKLSENNFIAKDSDQASFLGNFIGSTKELKKDQIKVIRKCQYGKVRYFAENELATCLLKLLNKKCFKDVDLDVLRECFEVEITGKVK